MMCIFNRIDFTNCPAYQFRTSDLSLLQMCFIVLPKPKTTYGLNSDMPQRDIGTRFLILLGEPLV